MRSFLVAVVVLAGCGDDAPTQGDATVAGDAPSMRDPCLLCARDQVCVQRYDGTCECQTECVTTTLRCSPNTCSTGCEQALCARPYQCANRPPCGTESPAAFTCYGP